MADLTVVGLGYIGLPTAAMFAAGGLQVRGVDVDAEAVATINSGAAHIVEPGLDEVVQRVVESKSLVATQDVGPSSAFLIAVPTPFLEGHQPDLSYVEAATRAIAPHLCAGDLVVLESTSPIGATEKVADWIRNARPDLIVADAASDDSVSVAYCPERVLPGNILHELVHNDRIVGGLTQRCAERAVGLYSRVVKGECRLTSARTAELAKLTENAFRDVNIAFANELSLVADQVGVNVWELIDLANLHPRVNILQPGPGVGGHCIAVDPWFIVAASEHARLIGTAREINDAKPAWVVDQVVDVVAGLEHPTIACLGLSYKPDIDDLRESPAIEVVQRLAGLADARVVAVEPNVSEKPRQLDGYSVEFVELDDALAMADVIVGLVPHQQIRELAEEQLAHAVVIDPAGIFSTTRESSVT